MDKSESLWFMFLFLVTGLTMIVVSIPMILHYVKPNRWYGFRTPKTLGNEEVWYKANAYCGILLLTLGIIHSTVSIKCYFLFGNDPLAYSLICTAILLAGLLILTILSFHYLRSL
jgi:uncharacterized membrane protein